MTHPIRTEPLTQPEIYWLLLLIVEKGMNCQWKWKNALKNTHKELDLKNKYRDTYRNREHKIKMKTISTIHFLKQSDSQNLINQPLARFELMTSILRVSDTFHLVIASVLVLFRVCSIRCKIILNTVIGNCRYHRRTLAESDEFQFKPYRQ